MKVLNLQCSHQHAFEGWFASEDDFQSQLNRGLLTCPMCADPVIQKMPAAPRLNFGASASLSPAEPSRGESLPAPVSPGSPSHSMMAAGGAAGQAAFLKALRQVLVNTEDVGERFADEARAMHYGETEHRNIRGQASTREAVELLEEGIDVMPLPMVSALKETLQ